MKTYVIAVGAACSIGAHMGVAWAHGDEDHGQGAASAGSVPAGPDQAPRAYAQTEQFEVVAQIGGPQASANAATAATAANGATLILFVDRFATNQPVEGATVEVESGAFKGVAVAQGAGVYRLPAPELAQPGRHPLTITVQAGDEADLLDATLVVGDAHAAEPAPGEAIKRYAQWLGRLAAGVLALGVMGGLWKWGVMMRRQRTQRAKDASAETSADTSANAANEGAQS